MLQIVGEVDVRHAAFAEVAFDPVAVGERGGEPSGHFGHGEKYDARVALAMVTDQVGDGPHNAAPHGRLIGTKPEGFADPYSILKQL